MNATSDATTHATIDLLATRRSVPPAAMSGPGPDAGELDLLLTLAARVPDHGKLAPWRFLVIQGDGRDRAGALIADAFAADEPGAGADRIALERGRLSQAPLVVGVISRARPHAKIPDWEQVMSAGAVCMNLIVAAKALGYAATWLTQWYAYDRRVLDGLGLDPDEKVAGFMHIGRAADIPPDRTRPDMPSIVTRF